MDRNLSIQEKGAGGALMLLWTVWKEGRLCLYQDFNYNSLVVKPIVSQYPPSYLN
jgi:hypothetical protein